MQMFVIAFVTSAVFAVFSFLADRRPQKVWTPALSAAGAALVIAVLVVACVIFPLKQQGHSVIAWTGLQTSGTNLSIGESEAHQIVGWPNGSFSPHLSVSCSENNDCALQMDGGGGFIRSGEHVLNGDLLTPEHPLELNGFRVSLVPGLLRLPLIHGGIETRFVHPRFRVDVPGSAPVFSASLGRELRPESMASLMTLALAELRRDSWRSDKGSLARTAMDLERWAAGMRVLPTEMSPIKSNSAFILVPQLYKVTLRIPARIDVLWPGRTLHAELERSADHRIFLRFEGPWQKSSPIPGAELGRNGEVFLAVSSQPRPGDVAFLLPLGGSESTRKILTMRGGLFVEGGQRQPNARVEEAPIPDDLLRKGETSGTGSVGIEPSRATSKAEIIFGEQSAVLETIPVQPRFWLLIVGVMASWLTFAFALDVTLRPPNGARYQQIQGIRLEDRRMLAALSIVVWAFLLLRLGLSLRYGWDPAHVDRVVVEGVAWALFGLAVVPGLMLRSAMMWLVQVQEPNRDDARRLPLLTGVLVLVGAGEMLLAEFGFWPTLAPQFRYGVRFWLIFLLSMAIVFLWSCIRINHEYLWDKRVALDPNAVGKVEGHIHRFVLEFSTRYSYFARSLDTPLWQKTFRANLQDKPFWSAYAAFGAAILVFVAAYASAYWLFHISFPGTEPLKEVIAPAVLCLPPICFLLNSRIAFPVGSNVASGISKPIFMRLCAVVAALVLLLAVVYPIVLGDPGALVVTLALFVPTSIILMVGDRKSVV